MAGQQKKAGFSLLELSVVLTIIAVITAMGMSMGNGMIESARRAQTNNKLNVIEDVLMSYRTAYNRLPCPTDPTIGNTSANYGVEAANPGSCTGGSPAIAAAATDATNKVVEGAVPFQALGLPEEFMYDGWGRKFAYAVNYNATAANAMLGESLSDMCGISLTNAGGAAGARSNKGTIYALVSYGPDGHGGYLRSGSRNNAGSTNTDEQTNCHCDVNANETTYAANYVEKDPTLDPNSSTDQFGDYVRFSERWQMATTDDFYTTNGTGVCTPNYGIRIDGTVASQALRVLGSADLNGDGIPDLILSGFNSGSSTYEIYVIFGQSSHAGFTPDPFLIPTSLNGTNGFTITGLTNSSALPYMVGTGDFNGDGIKDVVIAAPNNGCDGGGGTFVLFGQSSGWPTSIAWSALKNTSNPKATKIINLSESCPTNVTAGDLNNAKNGSNNLDDIIIGDTWAGSNKGDVYVIWGSTSIVSSVDVTSLGAAGVTLSGSHAGSNTGSTLAVGDFDGDGIADLAIGTYSSSGYGYIVWGHTGAWSALTLNGSMTAANGLEIEYKSGTAAISGYPSVEAVGDLNNDGVADLVFGADQANCTTGGGCGQIYVIFGAASLKSSNVFYVFGLNGTNGTVLQGDWGTDVYPVAFMVADINGDGKLDLLSGGNGYSTYSNQTFFNEGTTWTGTWASPMGSNLLTGSSSTGFDITGFTGPTYATAGDVDGDGIADYIVGDSGASPGGRSGAGAVYIVKGKGSGWTTPITVGSFSGKGYEIDGATAGDGVSAGPWPVYNGVLTGKFSNGSTNDLAISAPGASPGGVSGAGSVYLIWGSTTLPALLNLSTVTR
jgi:prepilin-type N-terminal cleavage/methylation domain-containing protein